MDHILNAQAPRVSAVITGDLDANSTYELVQTLTKIPHSYFSARTLLILAVVTLPVVSILLMDTIASLRERSKNLNYLTTLNLKDGNYQKASRDWQQNYEFYMKLGYEKFRHGAFQLWTPDGYVTVLSPDFITELKKMPDDKCNFYAGVANAVQGRHQFIDFSGKAPIHALKSMLTPKLDALMPGIMEETQYGITTTLPMKQDGWHDVQISDPYARIVGYVTGRLFMGLELSRQEHWLQSIIEFPDVVFRAARKMRRTPGPLRTFRLMVLREARRACWLVIKSRLYIAPIMKRRLAAAAQHRFPVEKDADMIQFNLEAAEKWEKGTPPARQAEQLMIIMLAGVHTSTIAGIHMLYDLASMTHFIEPLRDEINEVWDACNGRLDKMALLKMVKLDSFMKESQRLNPPSYSTFDRVVTAPEGITLSTGLHLPHGTLLTIPSSQVSSDGETWENPEEYDAFRFSKLRESPDAKYNFQYTTTTEKSLHFGIGRHVCPGRFVSTVENKVILSYLIRHFDFKLVDSASGRPKNLTFGPNISPDPDHKISIRRIRDHMK